MTTPKKPSKTEIDKLTTRLDQDAETGGYHLHPDQAVTDPLVEGLIVNEGRYGYRNCPCRLASGNAEEDLDIVCPCDYRDADVEEYGCCYCGLYVSQDVKDGKKEISSIPERRPPAAEREKKKKPATGKVSLTKLAYPVWRCSVCGYLCARQGPPGICPICKAKKERFERFM